MTTLQPVQSPSISVANMLQILGNNSGNVTLPVKGVRSGFILSHITGVPTSNNSEGTKVSDAIVLNTFLSKLSTEQAKKLTSLYTEAKENKIPLEKFMQTLKDMIQQLHLYGKRIGEYNLNGLVVNTFA